MSDSTVFTFLKLTTVAGGVYWGLTALHLLGHPNALSREETIAFVKSCQHGNGGFGAHPGHDAHMLYTVSAVQLIVTLDATDQFDVNKIAKCMWNGCKQLVGNKLLRIS